MLYNGHGLIAPDRIPQEEGMKKFAGWIFAVFLFSGIVSAADGRFIFNIYGNYLSLPANNFTNQDSQQKVFFEAKAAVAVSGNIYLWASHGYFPLHDSWSGWSSKSSFAEDIRSERTLAKRIIAGGGGVFIGFFEKNQLAVRAEIGICSIRNVIDSTISDIASSAFIRSEESSQSGVGMRGNLSFTYGIYKNVFAEISGGYMYAADKIDSVRTNLGGFHLAMGLGIQL
jgi:hypothetical protein